MKEKNADLLLLLTAVLWGLGYIGSDILLNTVNPIVLIFLRFAIASIVISVVFFKQISIKKDEIFSYLIVGGALFLGFLFQTVAMNYTSTTNVSFLTNVNIVFVPIIGFILFKHKMSFKHLIAVFITLLGVWILTGGVSHFLSGDILTIISSFFFALHIVLINHFSKKINIYNLVIGQMLVTCIFALTISLFLHQNIILQATSNIPVLLFVGFVPTALCFFFQNYGLKYTREDKGSIILGTEALWGAVFAILILNDPFSLNILIGGVLMMSAIFIDNIRLFKKR